MNKECGRGRETTRVERISLDTREKMWPFLTPRLENATEKTREIAPPLIKQIWSIFEEQLDVAEGRDMTVGRFVTASNEVTVEGFWMEHAKGERRESWNPRWEKKYHLYRSS